MLNLKLKCIEVKYKYFLVLLSKWILRAFAYKLGIFHQIVSCDFETKLFSMAENLTKKGYYFLFI